MFTRTTALSALAGAALLAASLGAAAPASAAAGTSVATQQATAGRPISSIAPKRMLGQPLQYAFGDYPNGPTVSGPQGCDGGNPDAVLAQTRHVWSYYNATDDTSGLSSNLTLSTWADAGQAFTDVVEDTGLCTWFEGQERVTWAGQDPSTHALFASATGSVAVILDGSTIIAVDVVDWDGDLDDAAGATSEALKLSRML